MTATLPSSSGAPTLSDDELRPGRLADLGERRIYDELLRPRYGHVKAFGDDCALVDGGLVMTTDSCPTPLLERVLDKDDPYHAGWLLATINLSDLAAAGARPLGLVVNYTLPKNTDVNDFTLLMKGVDECAKSHGTRVLGGDIRDGKERHLTATAIGRTRWRARGLRARGRLSRRGSRAGDALLLVGNPGYLWAWATATRRCLDLSDEDYRQLHELAYRPIAQVQAGRLLAERGLATAAVDVSDGLYASVRLLAAANGLGAELTGTIELDPVVHRVGEVAGLDDFQLGQTWGDWTLLVTVRADKARSAIRALTRKGIGVRRIGRLVNEHRNLLAAGAPWAGVDQERFSTKSWQGDGIDEQIQFMQRESRQD